jgi:hypothetical protein
MVKIERKEKLITFILVFLFCATVHGLKWDAQTHRKTNHFEFILHSLKQRPSTPLCLLIPNLRGGSPNETDDTRTTTGGTSDGERLMAVAEDIVSDTEEKRKITIRPSSTLTRVIGAFCSCFSTLLSVLWDGGGSRTSRASRDAKLEAAADNFVRAATAFKLDRQWRRAGEALTRAGDCYVEHSELAFEAARSPSRRGVAKPSLQNPRPPHQSIPAASARAGEHGD